MVGNDRAPAMVEVEGVNKRFGGTAAVEEIGFKLARGRFLTILGPSGSGKTTLLRMIAGFVRPDAGTIRVHGRTVADLPPHRRNVGMVFQRLALFPHMTAFANVAYPLRMRGFARDEIPARVADALRLVRLEGFERRRPHQLSGGQQQRVAIARALVFEPDLLLLDEPLAALDRKLRDDMQLEFRRIQQTTGVTTINVTHDQREALVMSDEIMVMDQGRLQQHSSPEETYRRPANRFVAGFLGVTNFIPGRIVALDGEMATLEVNGHRLQGRSAGGLAFGEPALGALRAERIRLHRDGRGTIEGRLQGTIADVIFEGDRLVCVIRLDDLDLELRAFVGEGFDRDRWRSGDRVEVAFESADLPLFAA